MRFFRNFNTSLKSYIEAIPLLFSSGLWIFFIFPILLSGVLWYAGSWLQITMEEWKVNSKPPENIRQVMSDVLSIGLSFVLVQVIFKATKYIVLIFMSPILAIISEKIDKIITGNKYPYNFKLLIHDIKRGIKIALRNMAIEYTLFLIWIIIAMSFSIPMLYTRIVLVCIGFYFYGFAMLDYVNERRRLSIDESIAFVRKNRGLAIGIGSVFSLLFFIPFIGIVIAPVVAIAAATIAMHKTVNLKLVSHAVKEENNNQ